MRTLRPAGNLKQLTYAMSRSHWNIVGLCEMRWKSFGEMSTDDGHKVYFSGIFGKERRRKQPWVTKFVLDICDESRVLKKTLYKAEGAKI